MNEPYDMLHMSPFVWVKCYWTVGLISIDQWLVHRKVSYYGFLHHHWTMMRMTYLHPSSLERDVQPRSSHCSIHGWENHYFPVLPLCLVSWDNEESQYWEEIRWSCRVGTLTCFRSKMSTAWTEQGGSGSLTGAELKASSWHVLFTLNSKTKLTWAATTGRLLEACFQIWTRCLHPSITIRVMGAMLWIPVCPPAIRTETQFCSGWKTQPEQPPSRQWRLDPHNNPESFSLNNLTLTAVTATRGSSGRF